MKTVIHVVCAPYIDYNDQTYDIGPSDTIVYTGTDLAAAQQALKDEVAKEAVHWTLDSFSRHTIGTHTTAAAVIEANFQLTSHTVEDTTPPLYAIFGPANPTVGEWGLYSRGIECWAIAPGDKVLDTIATHRDKHIAAWMNHAGTADTDVTETRADAIGRLVDTVKAVAYEGNLS